METILDLVYGTYNDGENQEQYNDIDDLRSDFIYFRENYNYDYIYARKITIDDEGWEDIDILFSYEK